MTNAGWYPDPTYPSNKVRYWNGTSWTEHVNTKAGWYPDPQNPNGQMRYWDGAGWTNNFSQPGKTYKPATKTTVNETLKFLKPTKLSLIGAWVLYVAINILTFFMMKSTFETIQKWQETCTTKTTGGRSVMECETALNQSGFGDYLAALMLTYLIVLFLLIVISIGFYKAASLSKSLGVEARLSPGWAVGGWFIPIGNLFLPYWSLSDMLPKTHPGRKILLTGWVSTYAISIIGGIIYFVMLMASSSFTSGEVVPEGFLTPYALMLVVSTLAMLILTGTLYYHLQQVSKYYRAQLETIKF